MGDGLASNLDPKDGKISKTHDGQSKKKVPMFIIKAHGVFKKNELNDLIPALRGQGSKEMNPEWNTQQRIDKRSGALGGPRLRKPDQKSLCGKLQDKGRETQGGGMPAASFLGNCAVDCSCSSPL